MIIFNKSELIQGTLLFFIGVSLFLLVVSYFDNLYFIMIIPIVLLIVMGVVLVGDSLNMIPVLREEVR